MRKEVMGRLLHDMVDAMTTMPDTLFLLGTPSLMWVTVEEDGSVVCLSVGGDPRVTETAASALAVALAAPVTALG